MFVNDATRHVAQEYLHGTVLRVSQSITCVIRPIWLTIVYCSRKYPYTPTPHGRQFALSPSPQQQHYHLYFPKWQSSIDPLTPSETLPPTLPWNFQLPFFGGGGGYGYFLNNNHLNQISFACSTLIILYSMCCFKLINNDIYTYTVGAA